jgi:hypothetical protein
MSITIFWNVDGRFKRAYCLHHQGAHRHDDGDTKHLSNFGQILQDRTAQYPEVIFIVAAVRT